jgi:hypothetical protein
MPYYDERLPVKEDMPELKYNIKSRQIINDEDWQMVRLDLI